MERGRREQSALALALSGFAIMRRSAVQSSQALSGLCGGFLSSSSRQSLSFPCLRIRDAPCKFVCVYVCKNQSGWRNWAGWWRIIGISVWAVVVERKAGRQATLKEGGVSNERVGHEESRSGRLREQRQDQQAAGHSRARPQRRAPTPTLCSTSICTVQG